MTRDKVAAIDLGTNTARLLIVYSNRTQEVPPVLLDRRITRLGGGFSTITGLSLEARKRTVSALGEFAAEMKLNNVTRYRAVATSAVRDAKNGQEFVKEVFDRTGIELEVIDGRKEGLLTLLGVRSAIDEADSDLVVFDVGGGSTEYTLARGKDPVFTRSLPLGVVRLTEGKVEPDRMQEKVERELATLIEEMRSVGIDHFSGTTLVGTAGTATTLAAIDMGMEEYDYRKVNNYVLSINSVRTILKRLLPMTPEERLSVPGLEKGREDLIIAGIFITLKTMEMLRFDKLKVSDFGLLEGLAVTLSTSRQ